MSASDSGANVNPENEPSVKHEDASGVYYVTADGRRYHYVWCHDCGGEGCDYCEGTGQVRVDDDAR